jgi:hypothetical protein
VLYVVKYFYYLVEIIPPISDHQFLFVLGSQGGKSILNPKAPVFSTYAAARNIMTREEGMYKLVLYYKIVVHA